MNPSTELSQEETVKRLRGLRALKENHAYTALLAPFLERKLSEHLGRAIDPNLPAVERAENGVAARLLADLVGCPVLNAGKSWLENELERYEALGRELNAKAKASGKAGFE